MGEGEVNERLYFVVLRSTGTMVIKLLSGDYYVAFITGVSAMALFIGWRKM